MTTVQREPAVTALSGLRDEFRNRRIITHRDEKKGMERHTSALSARWNDRFPGFPADHFPYTSFWGEHYRKHRDAHLKDISMIVIVVALINALLFCQTEKQEFPLLKGPYLGQKPPGMTLSDSVAG